MMRQPNNRYFNTEIVLHVKIIDLGNRLIHASMKKMEVKLMIIMKMMKRLSEWKRLRASESVGIAIIMKLDGLNYVYCTYFFAACACRQAVRLVEDYLSGPNQRVAVCTWHLRFAWKELKTYARKTPWLRLPVLLQEQKEWYAWRLFTLVMLTLATKCYYTSTSLFCWYVFQFDVIPIVTLLTYSLYRTVI